jgi:hypothetical protein
MKCNEMLSRSYRGTTDTCVSRRATHGHHTRKPLPQNERGICIPTAYMRPTRTAAEHEGMQSAGTRQHCDHRICHWCPSIQELSKQHDDSILPYRRSRFKLNHYTCREQNAMRGSGYCNVCLPFLAVWLVATSYITTITTAPQCQLGDSRAWMLLAELCG